jgi:hypothetical protein
VTVPHPPLVDALDDVAAMLAAAHNLDGSPVRVALDPADVELPGVVLYPNLLNWTTLDGVDYELSVDVLLVAGAVPARDAVGQLDELLAALRGVLPISEARAVSLNLPNHSADPLPALQATVTFSITREDTPA